MPYVRSRTSYAHRRALAGARRRKVVWATSLTSLPQTVDNGALITPLDLLTNLEIAGVGLVGATIVRIHGRLNVSGTAADTRPGIIFGLLVWDREMLANAPTVTTDFGADWMLQDYIVPGQYGPILNTSTAQFYSTNVDLKAKRRLNEFADTLVFCLGNVGTQDITYTMYWKIALMLA
jgi:hypothetical protein